MDDAQPSRVNSAPGTRREVFAWALYDWASSAYSTLSITILVSYLQADVFPGKTGVIVWGWGLGGTMLIAAVLSPILGAIADAHATKRKWLALTSLTGSVASFLMYFVPPEERWLVLALFLIASLGFELSLGFYNGFLPEIADDRSMGRVSAWGYALGYVGGGLALLMVILMFGKDTTAEQAREIKRVGLAVMGLWWGLFTIPSLLILKDRKARSREPEPFLHAARRAFGEVGNTIRNVRSYRILAIFLVSFLLYNEGVQTMISQSSVFAMQVLAMGAGELAQVVLMIQFIALPGSLAIGHLAEKLGQKPVLIGCILLWILLLIIAFFVTEKWQFWMMAAAAAIVLGGTQSVSRAIMGLMTPAEKSAEFFGFFNLSGKAVSVFGPVVFSTILAATESPHLAILSLLVFFVVGLVILLPVNVAKGQAQARGAGET
ncbi:MAG: MFS transporter [Planctomycetaceae bacterium]